jgi:hypothetical protein
MIILEGPDHTGKTTLARKIESRGLKYFHYTQHSEYGDYLAPMCGLDWTNAVLDRHAISEYPYHIVMNRPFRFSDKEWHNIIFTTLAYDPVIILCTSKPSQSIYDKDQYMPYSEWERCLSLYKKFLVDNRIPYYSYDMELYGDRFIDMIIDQHNIRTIDGEWWRRNWKAGFGHIGSPHPSILLVAERLGPNNVNNIPFETGPTGQMLTNLLIKTNTPLYDIAITNYIKAERRSTRKPNSDDDNLISEEILKLLPTNIVLMGNIAKGAVKHAVKADIPYSEVPHFGSYAHKGIYSINQYLPFWRKLIGTNSGEL